MSNVKIRFTALKSSLLTSFVIFIFLTTLFYFSRSLYDSVKVSIPYKYIFIALLILIVTTLMSIILSLFYILISEPSRSVEETCDSLELLSYYLDSNFRFTNSKEYAKAVEMGLR